MARSAARKIPEHEAEGALTGLRSNPTLAIPAAPARVARMAIYHFRAQVISRGQGRSLVAAAAYRHGTRMLDERTGLTHAFEARRDVVHSEFALPAGAPRWASALESEAGAPARASEAFWNRLDAFEARSNARLCREIEFSLPNELTREENIALVREFVAETFSREGIVADWAYHDKANNPHVHVMLTLRPLTEAGFGANWLPVRDPHSGDHLRTGSGKLRYAPWSGDVERLIAWRAAWAEVQNRHLAIAGVAARVTHESYRTQGIAVAPTAHVGVHASAVRRSGKASIERDRLGPAAKERNRDLFLGDPGAVLRVITRERSVFDARDVARTIHRLVDDPAAFDLIRLRVMACPDLVELAPALDDPETGRELQRARYTTAEMLKVESRMMARAAALRESGGYEVSRASVETAIAARSYLSAEQRVAVRHLAAGERIASVVGFAGAGKSTMLAAVREAWEAQGYRVHGAALAGKAAEGLETSSGIRSRTLASWELAWTKGYDRLGVGDVLVIDEAGMVASRQMERFVSTLHETGAKLVLVGDAAQLQPIEAGAAFRAIAEVTGYAELTEVRRQHEDWAREASVSFAQGRVDDAIGAYAGRGFIRFDETREIARESALDGWIEDRARGGSTLILAHANADVYALNEGARARLKAGGELGDEHAFLTARGTRRFASGDRVLFLENNRDLGVKNGMLGTVATAEPGRLAIVLDSQGGISRTVHVDQRGYTNVDWGYAATIHKAQGATVDRVRVLAAATMDRHLAYVAMSRHREGVVMHAGREDFRDLVALTRKLSRSGAKEVSTDHVVGQAVDRFAERRGLVTWREVAPALLDFVAKQAAWIAAMRAEIGRLWSRAEAALTAKRAAVAPLAAPAVAGAAGRIARATNASATQAEAADRSPRAGPVQVVDAPMKDALREDHRSTSPGLVPGASDARGAVAAPAEAVRRAAELRRNETRLGAQVDLVADAAERPHSAAVAGPAPGPITPTSLEPSRPPALIEPLREFDETVAMVARRAVFASARYPREEATIVRLARSTFHDPAPIIRAISGALDREPDDFMRHVGQAIDAAVARGGVKGKAGLFASKAEREQRAAALGRTGSLKQHAGLFHAWVRAERRVHEAAEERRRDRLAVVIPMPSERLHGILAAIGAAAEKERTSIVREALSDDVLGRELWGFTKAMEERFGGLTGVDQAKHVGEVPGSADGLASPDRARSPEAQRIVEAGWLAAREVRVFDAEREARRLVSTVGLSKEQGLASAQ